MKLKYPFLLLSVLLTFAWTHCLAQDTRPNILMLCIDDMNDWAGFLGGHPQAKTPNMDELASRGVNFTNAHCPSPACSPSRNAIFLGAEPFNSGFYPFYDLKEVDRSVLDRFTNLPRFLKENGYTTCGISKVFHNPDNTYEKAKTWDDYASYRDKNIKRAPGKGLPDAKILANVTNKYNLKKIFNVTPGTNEFKDFMDYKTASHAVGFLEKSHDKPFFLAVGFIRPHIEFVTPESYYDKFVEEIQPPAIKADDLNDVPPVGKTMVRSVASDIEKYDSWEELRRGYLACIAFTDYNVGRVLEALEESPYAKNTIIILWSDHGFHLGEKQSYTKFSLWEESTRVPFIIYDPSGRDGNGQATDEPVGLINVYRTVSEFAGLEPPEYVDGISLVPWLDNPLLPMEEPAITTWGRGNYSLRSKDWRYTRYYDGTEELYDHRNDPNEWNNLADDHAYADVKHEMAAWLPKEEAPQVASGRKLYNVTDADKPL